MTTLVLLLLSIVPHSEPVLSKVDVLERNWFYDTDGKLVFCQLIGWTTYANDKQHVCFWRLVKSPGLVPQFDHRRGDWFVLWFDGECFREVRAVSYSETWEQFDPEAVDRGRLPPDQRRELPKAVVKWPTKPGL